jgi:hypothetical protein
VVPTALSAIGSPEIVASSITGFSTPFTVSNPPTFAATAPLLGSVV